MNAYRCIYTIKYDGNTQIVLMEFDSYSRREGLGQDRLYFVFNIAYPYKLVILNDT